MLTDAQIRHAAHTMMESVAVSTAPLDAIQKRIAMRHRSPGVENLYRRRRRAIAAVVALVALPSLAYAVVGYEARSREALQERGGWAPPQPPVAFVSKLRPETVTLLQAKATAGFSLIAPVGLPAGALLVRIEITSIGTYDESTHAWRTGPKEVVFRYRRMDGRTFDITAQRYDGRALPGRYIFEDRGPDAGGNPTLAKHERFAWRNGDQMTGSTAGSAISKEEILSMIRSMNGTPLTLPWPSSQTGGALRVLGR